MVLLVALRVGSYDLSFALPLPCAVAIQVAISIRISILSRRAPPIQTLSIYRCARSGWRAFTMDNPGQAFCPTHQVPNLMPDQLSFAQRLEQPVLRNHFSGTGMIYEAQKLFREAVVSFQYA